MEKDAIILGAGLTGLSLSHFMHTKTLILEKEDRIGGLCRSFRKGKFTYDIGGHIIFSKDTIALDFMVDSLGKNVRKLYRNNRIFFKGKFVKYPFENGLGVLDEADRFNCLYNFIFNKYPKPKNFRQWIYHRFGKGIGSLYLEPYNRKIWKYPLEKMSMAWVDRVPRPPAEDVIKSALGIETEGYVHQLYFYYPTKGGIEALPQAIMQRSRKRTEVKLNFKIKKIKRVGEAFEVTDGKTTFSTKRLISTIPIFELIKLLDGVPEKLKSAAGRLKYTGMYVVLVGLKNPDMKDKTALYVPDKSIIFHRLVFNKYFGENYTSKSRSAVTAEITFLPGSRLDSIPDKEIVSSVIEGLVKMNLIKKKEVVETDIKKIKYAYVIYDEDHRKNMKIIRDYFSSVGIHLCGRFSEFEYLNMDACIRHSLELARELSRK